MSIQDWYDDCLEAPLVLCSSQCEVDLQLCSWNNITIVHINYVTYWNGDDMGPYMTDSKGWMLRMKHEYEGYSG